MVETKEVENVPATEVVEAPTQTQSQTQTSTAPPATNDVDVPPGLTEGEILEAEVRIQKSMNTKRDHD